MSEKSTDSALITNQTKSVETACPKSTLSVVDSPARIFQWQESRPGLTEPGRVFGQSSTALLANYNPDTSSLKTCQTSLFSDLNESSVTLPKSGMMRNGKLYQQTTLVHHTAEKESGLWPTPQVFDAKATENFTIGSTKDRGKKKDHTLPMAVKMYPTPKRPSGGGQIERKTPGGGIRKLEDAISAEVGYNTGLLNPIFVEWLMGYPEGWTDLRDSGTQLSLKSQR